MCICEIKISAKGLKRNILSEIYLVMEIAEVRNTILRRRIMFMARTVGCLLYMKKGS